MKMLRFIIAVLLFASQSTHAGINNPGSGSGGGGANVAQTVMGLQGASALYLNLAQTTGGGQSSAAGWPGTLNSTGYPTNSTTTSVGLNDLKFISNYFGRYKTWWSGTGAYQFSSSLSYIVYSGGTSASFNTATGNTNFNLVVGAGGASTQPTSAAPVEFSNGALITAISDGGSCAGGTAGLVCLTSSNGLNNVQTGQIVQVNNITNLSSGPWTLTKLDNSHAQLQGSTFSVSMAVVGGGPGPQSEMIYQLAVSGWSFPAAGGGTVYSNMTGMAICRSQNVGIGGLSDCANIGTHYANPDYVAVIKAANPRWVRVMDQESVQGSFATSYANRPAVGNYSWGVTTFVPAYWGGLDTNVSDTFTTAGNPTASPASGVPVDGEIVEGYISAANTTNSPLLAVNRAGFGAAKPILGTSIAGLSLFTGGSAPATGTTVTFVFTGGGLSTPFSYHYTTSTSVSGPGGVLDTSLSNIAVNIRADINGNVRGNAGALVTANIVSENPEASGAQMTFSYNPNINSSGVAALGTGLTITGSDSASSGIYTFGYVPVGYLPTNANVTFTYSAIAGGWATTVATTSPNLALPGPNGGPPLEFYEDLVNLAGVGLWFNVPVLYSDAAVTSTFQHMATAGVKEVVAEVSNETWNTGGGGQWHVFNSLGAYYGWKSNFNGGPAVDDLTGLRAIQVAAAARTGFTNAGVSQSKFFMSLAYQFTSPSSERFNGTNIVPGSNVTLAAYGGSPSNGTATPGTYSTNSSAFPNRPRDWAAFLSPAPYWTGTQFNSSFGSAIRTSVNAALPLAAYNCSLVASYNYVNGNASEQTAALNFMFNGTTGDFYNLTGLTQATVTASITSGVMNVTSVLTGGGIGVAPFDTMIVSGSGIAQPVFISSNGSGTGGNGTYNLSNGSLTVGSETITISALSTGFSLGVWANATGIPTAASYYGIPAIVAADDALRTGTNPHTGLPWQLLGVAAYEGDQQAGPISSGDTSTISSNLSTLGDTAGYSSGLSAQCGMTPHVGGPSSTVAGDASNMQALLAGFKNSNQFKLLYLQYFNDFQAAVNAPGARIAIPATYGLEGIAPIGGTWSKYPGSIYNTPAYQSLNAIQTFN